MTLSFYFSSNSFLLYENFESKHNAKENNIAHKEVGDMLVHVFGYIKKEKKKHRVEIEYSVKYP